MLKHLLAAAVAAALIAVPAVPSAYAQAAAEKSETKKPKKAKAAKKELTPQQAKMKDCAAKWGDHKKEKKVKGRTEYRKFMSGCLKA
jgi:hypothetical protein